MFYKTYILRHVKEKVSIPGLAQTTCFTQDFKSEVNILDKNICIR